MHQNQRILKRSETEQSIFALRAGFLGDVLMSTAAIRSVRKALPDSTIVYATWDICRPLLERNPDIDYVLPIGAYRLNDFDVHVDIRHELLMDEHSKAHNGLYPTEYWGELHFTQFERVLSGLHRPTDFRPVIYIDPQDYQGMERESGAPLVVINVWSKNGVNWRLMNVNKWVRLVKFLQDQGCVVVQLGGPNDPQVPGVNMALHSLSLRQSIGVMSHADFVIGIDSFIMHVASARIYDRESGELIKDGVDGCLISGPIAPANVVPVGSPVVPFEAANQYCPDKAPCGHSFATPELQICKHQNACMNLLEVEELWQWIKPLLMSLSPILMGSTAPG